MVIEAERGPHVGVLDEASSRRRWDICCGGQKL